MRDTGYRFPSVALSASKVGPDDVNVSGFTLVTVLTPPTLVKLDTQVGISQAGANTHFGRR